MASFPTWIGRHPVRLVLLVLAFASLACNIPGREPADTTDGGQGQSATNPAASSPTPKLIGTGASVANPTRTPFPTATPSQGSPNTPTPVPVFPTTIPLPTPTPLPPIPGATQLPGFTPLPSSTPLPLPTSTPIPVNPGANRFRNPGFEGSVRSVVFNEVNVFEGWEPFYCDEPYTPQKCQVPRPCSPGQSGGCNPPELKMGRPEYKPSNLAGRVHGGLTAQQWFCYYRTCAAGVFQTIATKPGETCEVGAYIQSWSNTDGDIASELSTADDRANSTWQIMVDTGGGSYAFAGGLLKSSLWGYDQGIYDQYVRIFFSFKATGSSTTIFFMDSRLWPIENNDSYIDDAYAICK